MASSKRLHVVPDIPAALLKKYLAQDIIAVDTELQGLQLWRDQVCLVQMCDRKGNVCLVRPTPPHAPPNLKRLLTHPGTLKVFHYAVTDVSFLRASLGVTVKPYECTKVMSKLVRTYANRHSLLGLVGELVGVELAKEQQLSNWSSAKLSEKQLVYAANDVIHLIPVYDALTKMVVERGKLPSGITAEELNRESQASLKTFVDLILNGYGDRDQGWETSVFFH
ncbi:MAG: 3'-5' exonuclease [SAR324 cluster bacterium]|nr:3'-5' exonuclease [SAR324 cluster bacterium]